MVNREANVDNKRFLLVVVAIWMRGWRSTAQAGKQECERASPAAGGGRAGMAFLLFSESAAGRWAHIHSLHSRKGLYVQ